VLAVLVCVAALVEPRPVAAQTSGSISGTAVEGTVTDPTGAVVAGAKVELVSGLVVTRSVTTDSEGRYRVDSLQPGDYTVRVTARGFQSTERRVNVAASGSVVADVRLDIQTLKEDVLVRGGTVTVPNTAQATADIQRTPGAVDVVPDTAFKNGPADTIKDVLGWVPGVSTSESRYGDDARVSIRGSALSRPFGTRGVNMFMDGIPINTSDGLVDLFEIDPTAYRYVEVFKGANGMRYGANSLGGAINFVTPTGRDASQFGGRIDGGGFGYERAQAGTGGVNGKFDYFFTASQQRFDGYRDHSQGNQERGSGNVGYQFSPKAETRFYVNANSIRDHMPGELDKTTALTSPTTANSDFTWKDQQRNIDSFRIANKTTMRFDSTIVDFGVFVVHRHVDHPNWAYLDFTVDDNGGFVRVADDRAIGAYRNKLVVGLNLHEGSIDSKSYWYSNTFPFGSYPTDAIPGAGPGAVKGTLWTSTLDTPKTTSVYLDDAIFLRSDIALNVGTEFQHAVRPREDRLNAAQTGSLTFNNVTPKVGLLWDVDRTSQVFANVSRSAEAPTYDVNPTVTVSAPLKAQTATTFEIGTRGGRPDITWDLSLYRAQIDNELQCVSSYPGSCNYVNAGHTVHQGIEAGVGVEFLKSVLSQGGSFRFNAAYSYNDFHYDGDPVYSNNRLAGVPTHFIRAEVLYYHSSGFYAGPNTEWMPTRYFADNANTTTIDPYGLLNVKLGYDKTGGRWSPYVEGRNLLDKRYIALFDVAGNANDSAQIFYPGTGRSIRAGLRFKW
jgi:iron complex outermembrane receptor protein